MILSTLLLAFLQQPIQQSVGRAASFTEGFETGTNVGNWSFFGDPSNGIEVIEPSGGNPGAFLHSTCDALACLDTFAPQLRTQEGVASIFTGDYRANDVRSLSVDLAIFGPAFVTTGGRPLTLILRNDPGTPGDPFDDVVVYKLGHRNIPAADGKWRRYTVRVPSASTTLPNGWQVLQGTGNNDADWNQVITGVSQVEYFFGDPTMFFIFQQWELGVDDLSIRMGVQKL